MPRAGGRDIQAAVRATFLPQRVGLRRRLGALAWLAALGALACGWTASGARAESVATPPASEEQPAPVVPIERVLSNERTFTTWAHPEIGGGVYARADGHSKQLARIHLLTEDGFPEVYMVLAQITDAEGREWVKIRIPGRPNGREGWMLRELLGPFHTTHWQLVIDLHSRRLTAYYQGRRRMIAPVGVGKPSTPTPTGHFWIRERFRLTDPSNPYYPWALGTSDYSTLSEWPGGGVVGIHGDFGAPQLIPGDPSHGCIRMHRSDLAWLAPRITLGTPVDIIAG
jgi:hypothetical protein